MAFRGRAWALPVAWAFAFFCSPGLLAQDLLLSPREQTTSLQLGDVNYQPGDGFKLGPLRLHPFLRQKAELNDNLFLTESGTVLGFMYCATPGLRVDLLPGNHEFSAGYKGRWYKCLWKRDPSFANASAEALFRDRAAGLDRFEHVAELRSVLTFPWAKLKAHATYESLSDPLNFEYAGYLDRSVATGSLLASFVLNRVLLEAGADLAWWDFKGAFDYLDSLQWSLKAEGGYRLGAKFFASLSWAWTRLLYSELSAYDRAEYGEHSDFETHSVAAGVKGSLGPKLDLSLKAGVSYRILLEGTESGRGEAAFFGRAMLKWSATESLLVESAYAREYQLSQYSSYQVMDRFDLKLVYSFSMRVSGRVYAWIENTAPAGGASFFRLGAGLQAEYRAFSWMSLGAGYEWLSRHTSIPLAEFANNKVWLHLTVYF